MKLKIIRQPNNSNYNLLGTNKIFGKNLACLNFATFKLKKYLCAFNSKH
jgi:hypothetical protein